ncbi:hypothetical protein PM082_009352 [Marasmius tenuissimus]|nr:hypothetical protein PM082_009352 [Marasmius tenuissimus]
MSRIEHSHSEFPPPLCVDPGTQKLCKYRLWRPNWHLLHSTSPRNNRKDTLICNTMLSADPDDGYRCRALGKSIKATQQPSSSTQ